MVHFFEIKTFCFSFNPHKHFKPGNDIPKIEKFGLPVVIPAGIQNIYKLYKIHNYCEKKRAACQNGGPYLP